MKIEIRQPYSFRQIGRSPRQEDARFPDLDVPGRDTRVFVVCDGVGGHGSGDIASALVAAAVGEYMCGLNLSRPLSAETVGKAVGHAMQKLREASDGKPSDMSTTLAMVCLHGGGVMAAHIGDSRIYHIRPDAGILYRSEDHSLVNVLVHTGNITPQEAMNHPQSNVITRSIGCSASGERRSPASVMQISDVERGDYLFVCSDGLTKVVDDDMLVQILSGDATDFEKTAALARLCCDSVDNSTAFLIPVAGICGVGSEHVRAAGCDRGEITELLDRASREVRDVSPDTRTKDCRLCRRLAKWIARWRRRSPWPCLRVQTCNNANTTDANHG